MGVFTSALLCDQALLPHMAAAESPTQTTVNSYREVEAAGQKEAESDRSGKDHDNNTATARAHRLSPG